MNGLMALPNLIGLLGLSSVIVIESKNFFALLAQEKQQQNGLDSTHTI
jgi:AGCS family alanine or glycine:cation symporter